MLPALVLSIAIRAHLWRPAEKQGKAEWVNISYQCAVHDKRNYAKAEWH